MGDKPHIMHVINLIEERMPGVRWTQLRVSQPGVDDDGIWFFWMPGQRGEVQLETSTGMLPFLAETDKYNERMTCNSVEDAASIVCDWLRLPGGGLGSGWYDRRDS
jgi:hypothetical protein